MTKILKDIFFVIFGLVIAFDDSWTIHKFGAEYPYNLIYAVLYELIFGFLLIVHILEYKNSNKLKSKGK